MGVLEGIRLLNRYVTSFLFFFPSRVFFVPFFFWLL